MWGWKVVCEIFAGSVPYGAAAQGTLRSNCIPPPPGLIILPCDYALSKMITLGRKFTIRVFVKFFH